MLKLNSSKFKVYYYYQNVTLWKYKNINKLQKKKWNNIKQKSIKINGVQYYSIGKYICHYKKLNISKLYYFKFINKQILKKYLVNYKEFNFKNLFLTDFCNLERRLDYNLYKTNFVTSLYEARFYISKGLIFVNQKKVLDYNYLLTTNDLVELDKSLCNSLLKRNLFKDFQQFIHLRNLVIDYKTFSFIFLNKTSFFIINYNNFIKKTYYNLENNNNKYKTLGNFSNYNNYYKFFNTILTDYLFLDKQKKVLIKNVKSINSYKTNLLIKFLKYKYNDFYFRNILLKSNFNLKFNYLNFLSNNKISNFENLQNILKINNTVNKNTLNNDFFNYYYYLIFNFYLLLLKNFNIINNFYYKKFFSIIFLNKNFSINQYTYLLILNFKFIKFLQIRYKLNYYYETKFNSFKTINYNASNLVLKTINNKLISQNFNQKYHYYSKLFYKNLCFYISSPKFSYKIYRRCKNFKQNNFKRIKIIRKIQKSFGYIYFNCNRFGIFNKNLFKRKNFNQLKLNNLKINNKVNNRFYIENNKTNKFYYPIIHSQNENIIDLLKIANKKLTNYNKILINFNVKDNNIINYIISLKKQLYLKNKIIVKNTTNYYYQKNLQNIYLLSNLINNYFVKNSFNKKLLKNLNVKVQIKQHYMLNLNYNSSNNKHYIKKYRRFMNDYKRFQLVYYYKDYKKSKLISPLNLNSYFVDNLYNVKNLKKLYYYYNCSFYDFKSLLINRFSKKSNNTNFTYRITNYKNLYKSKYLSKRINSLIAISKINYSKINYLLNLNLINYNLQFNDNLFYIDLILNLAARKFNLNYNQLSYMNFINNRYVNNYNTFLIYKNKKNSKKLNKIILKKKYIFKTYNLKYFINIYNYNYNNFNFKSKTNNKFIIKYKNIKKNNKLFFYINTNTYNYCINYKLFNLYYNYNKQIIKHSKIFIKLTKINYLNNIYKIYNYYSYNLKKYAIIKYLYKNYIFKEYNCFLNKLLTSINIKEQDVTYVKQIYYNLLFTKLFNFTKLDNLLENNYIYSKNLKIIINYFILINRFFN